MISKSAIKQYSFFLFLLFLATMGCWFIWGNRALIQSILGLCLLFTAKSKGIKLQLTNYNILLCLVFYFSYILVSLTFSLKVILTQLPSYLIPIICVICISPDLKKQVVPYITKWFAYLMIPSFIIYLISFGIKSSPFGTITPNLETYGLYDNFLFYVRQIGYYGNFQRFSGPFMEPGHLGMMCSFLLFANHFDFKKKENIIITFILLVTLSLAGYVLGIIGFFFIRYYQGKIKVENLVLYVVLIGGFFFTGRYYNGGDNLLNEKIFLRLDTDEEKGIVGNNRTSLYVMELYAEMFDDPKLLLMGYSKEDQEAMSDYLQGNSYQLFIVRHGVIQLLVAFSFYLLVLFHARDKKYAILFFLFVVLCFLQRTYPFWMSWIICYEYAIRAKECTREKKRQIANNLTR